MRGVLRGVKAVVKVLKVRILGLGFSSNCSNAIQVNKAGDFDDSGGGDWN